MKFHLLLIMILSVAMTSSCESEVDFDTLEMDLEKKSTSSKTTDVQLANLSTGSIDPSIGYGQVPSILGLQNTGDKYYGSDKAIKKEMGATFRLPASNKEIKNIRWWGIYTEKVNGLNSADVTKGQNLKNPTAPDESIDMVDDFTIRIFSVINGEPGNDPIYTIDVGDVTEVMWGGDEGVPWLDGGKPGINYYHYEISLSQAIQLESGIDYVISIINNAPNIYGIKYEWYWANSTYTGESWSKNFPESWKKLPAGISTAFMLTNGNIVPNLFLSPYEDDDAYRPAGPFRIENVQVPDWGLGSYGEGKTWDVTFLAGNTFGHLGSPGVASGWPFLFTEDYSPAGPVYASSKAAELVVELINDKYVGSSGPSTIYSIDVPAQIDGSDFLVPSSSESVDFKCNIHDLSGHPGIIGVGGFATGPHYSDLSDGHGYHQCEDQSPLGDKWCFDEHLLYRVNQNCAEPTLFSIDQNLETAMMFAFFYVHQYTDGSNWVKTDVTAEYTGPPPPTMICQDITVALDQGHNTAHVTADMIDGGSESGIEDEEVMLSIEPSEYFTVGVHNVVLIGSNSAGGISKCNAIVTVDPHVEQIIISSGVPDSRTITPPDAPISFTATASGGIVPTITDVSCYTFNGAGKWINKASSCEVSVDGPTITIHDSGGVGDIIAWTIKAGTEEVTVEIQVVNPNTN